MKFSNRPLPAGFSRKNGPARPRAAQRLHRRAVQIDGHAGGARPTAEVQRIGRAAAVIQRHGLRSNPAGR